MKKAFGSEREIRLGKATRQTIGTRKQVWEGKAHHTTGGLLKEDIVHTKNQGYIAKSRRAAANRNVNFKAHTIPKKRSASSRRPFIAVKPEYYF